MNVTVNGVDETLSSALTISAYLAAREIKASTVVVELNGEIIKDEDYDDRTLSDGDGFEILRILGGG